jgi:hypothetical protein
MSQDTLLLSLRECRLSDWYSFPEDHRCPHDAWVEALTLSELASGERHEERELQIQIRLLGAYHDGIIEFTYKRVKNYSLQATGAAGGHGDWLRDEVEDRDGFILHTVLFANGKIQIEAKDVEYKWTALPNRLAPR